MMRIFHMASSSDASARVYNHNPIPGMRITDCIVLFYTPTIGPIPKRSRSDLWSADLLSSEGKYVKCVQPV